MKKNKFYFAEWYLRKHTGPDQELLKSDDCKQQIIKETLKAVLIEISKWEKIEINNKTIMKRTGSKSFWVPKSAFFENFESYRNYLISYHLLMPESMQIKRAQFTLYAIATGEELPLSKATRKFKNASNELFVRISKLKSMKNDYCKKEEFEKKLYYKNIEAMIKEGKGLESIDSKISYVLENQEKFFSKCKLIVLLLENQEKRDEQEGNTNICNQEVYNNNKIFLQNCGL